MRLEVAEAAGECEVLLGGDALVAEEDDLVLEQRAPDLGDGLVGEVVAQVDARELGADRRAERLNAEMVIGLLLSVGVDGSQGARSDVKLRHRSSPSCPLLTRCPCEVNATRGNAKTCRTGAPPVWLLRTRMSFTGRSCARRALVMAVGFLVALAARPALSDVDVRFERLDGFAAPGTPADLNKVGVLEIGPKRARNILVLNPGTSASAAYFAPLAKTVVEKAKGWQVWAVERRENLLEDHSVLDQAKDGTATGQELFDYYLGWLTDPSITNHFQFIPDADVAFAREWGMRVEIEDLRRVVKLAQKRRPQGRPRRPLARRLDHHRLRDLGLRRQARRQGPRRPRVHRRRQQPDPDHPRAGDRVARRRCRPPRRG